jgi:hypothetical protein
MQSERKKRNFMKLLPAFIGSPLYQAGLTLSKGFNRKADVITTGSVYSGVQSSCHIRARQELECNGFARAHSELQRFDLKTFCFDLREMRRVHQFIEKSPFFETNSGIAYRFFHFKGETRIIHGVILTDSHYNLIRRFDSEELGTAHRPVSVNVLDFCQQFVCRPQPLAA